MSPICLDSGPKPTGPKTFPPKYGAQTIQINLSQLSVRVKLSILNNCQTSIKKTLLNTLDRVSVLLFFVLLLSLSTHQTLGSRQNAKTLCTNHFALPHFRTICQLKVSRAERAPTTQLNGSLICFYLLSIEPRFSFRAKRAAQSVSSPPKL